jgi:hypothetical protein
VVFPEPDGPSKQKNSPSTISTDTLSTACTAEASEPKVLLTFTTETAATVDGVG